MPAAPARPPRSLAPHLPYFLASFAWNYGLGMTWLVVPLYAHSKGLSGGELGLLFSLPAIVQLAVNLLGGALVDRVGGRRIMLLSSALLAAGAALMPLAQGFAGLFAAQLVLVLGRATFWPANWSLATELPGERGVQAGRLNAVTSFGQILGNGACGFILVAAGYTATFLVLAGFGLAALALGAASPRPAAKARPEGGLFDNYARLVRQPALAYTVMCAYVSALPFSLAMSFYPLLLQHLGFGEASSGILLALRSVGGIACGLVVARFVRTGPASPWPIVAGAFIAVAVGLQPVVAHWAGVAALMLAVGFGAGLMTVYFQVTIAETVPSAMRGSAMALGGLGWGISHLTTPLVMGFLADRHGIAAGFYAIGAISLVVLGLVASLRGWAFSRPTHAARP